MKLNYRLNDYSLEESKAGLAALCFEKCPVYSTVQRLGRTCRESHPRGGRYSHVYIFSTKSLKTKKEILPYTSKDLEGSEGFFKSLVSEGKISHEFLINTLEKFSKNDTVDETKKYCNFVDGGIYINNVDHYEDIDENGNKISKRRKKAIRSIKEYSGTIILSRHLEEFKTDKDAINKYSISVSIRRDMVFMPEETKEKYNIPTYISIFDEKKNILQYTYDSFFGFKKLL